MSRRRIVLPGQGGSVGSRILAYGGIVAVVTLFVVVIVLMLVRGEPAPDPAADEFQLLSQGSEETVPDRRPQVEVLNGCGVGGIAARAHAYLRERGFDVVNVENAKDFRYPETLVIDRGGDESVARSLARTLGTENVIRQVRPDLLLEVTVILGEDHRQLKPYREIDP
ncbi:MAG: LytR C-terminal domain-containing protein [bacterium]